MIDASATQKLTRFRHDDLKPSNILIHGSTVLLTDFGFWYAKLHGGFATTTDHICDSLDTSDTGITTTRGPPSHSTIRYSAPEVFRQTPRSRLTDVWSLGCVLCDIVARLLGFKLETMKSVLRETGNCIDSYAENRVALSRWFTKLAQDPELPSFDERVWLISFIMNVLLEPNRLLRPTAAQILERLQDLPRFHHNCSWIGSCCKTTLWFDFSMSLFKDSPWKQLSALHGGREWVAVIFLNTSLRVLSCSDNLPLPADVDEFLGGGIDKLRATVDRLEGRAQNDLTLSPLNADFKVPFEHFAKSLYLSGHEDVHMERMKLPLQLRDNSDSSFQGSFLVTTILAPLQLKRQPYAYRTPFVAMMLQLTSTLVDPSEE